LAIGYGENEREKIECNLHLISWK